MSGSKVRPGLVYSLEHLEFDHHVFRFVSGTDDFEKCVRVFVNSGDGLVH